MGTITYYPKGSSYSSTQGITLIYPAVTPRMILIIGPGIGERNSGDLAGCKLSSGWGGWGGIKSAADVYGIIQIYINTTNNYENSEYQNAMTWARGRYPTLVNMIWIWGHSLGSYGAGNYAFTNSTFAQQAAGWIQSGPGPFTSSSTLWNNLVNNGIKVWGVTAENDTVMGTYPGVVKNTYTQMKALSSSARVIKSVFPSTEWLNNKTIYEEDGITVATNPDGTKKIGSTTAHNAVLNRLSTRPRPYYSKGNFRLITTGLLTSNDIVMDVFQWMLSNPKTSIYQDPTSAYSSPKYSNPTTPPPPPPATTLYFKAFFYDGAFAITWTDGPDSSYVLPAGNTLHQLYEAFSAVDGESRPYLMVKMKDGANVITQKQFGPRKT
jgi:hypothetical protein